MGAKRALLHHMFLMGRDIRISYSEVYIILRFFPVKAPDTRIGAGRDTHPATDALIVVLKDDSILLSFVGGAYRAGLGAGGVFAVLARCWNVTNCAIGILSTWDINVIPTDSGYTIPPGVVWKIVCRFASYRACLAAHTPKGVDDHS
jgi:hypothetical protein